MLFGSVVCGELCLHLLYFLFMEPQRRFKLSEQGFGRRGVVTVSL